MSFLPSCTSTADDVYVAQGIEYARQDGVPLLLDVYLPMASGLRPAILLIHGGGWEAGSRSDISELGGVPGEMWARAGFAAFAVDYRLAPEHSYPAALEDVKSAVHWIRQHAEELRVDPGGIGAFGMSAGGHLAAMLAVSGEGSLEHGSRIRAAASWSGPLDLAETVRDSEFLRPIVARFLRCQIDRCRARLDAASVSSHIDSTDAPTLIVNSEQEFVPLDQATSTVEDFRRSGILARAIVLPGASHGAYADSAVPGARQTVWEATVAFLHEWLHRDTGATKT